MHSLFSNIKKIISKWCILVPIAYLVPKKRNLVLFIGKNKGRFCDNVKYLYLHFHKLKESNIQYYFLTEHKCVYESLTQNKLPVVYHPTLLSIYVLLRANILIVDSESWRLKSKYYLSFKSKKIQLWHGVSLKRMESAVPKTAKYINSFGGKLDAAVRGKFINHDLLISTSEFFTQKVFSKAFRTKCFLESGYPRNDVFFNHLDDEYVLIGSDKETISKVSKLREDGYKIILYAPTFRDTGGDPITDGALNPDSLSEFANKNKAVFVFKFHVRADTTYKLEAYDGIIKCDNSQDIQPLLKVSDILITDYSSVYMDYLLLDRPVIFFPYDYKKYIEKDRSLFFDYDWITPGPKCSSQDELEKTLIDYIIEQKDDFSAKRTEIRNLAFKYKDGNASERIWNFVKQKYLDR